MSPYSSPFPSDFSDSPAAADGAERRCTAQLGAVGTSGEFIDSEWHPLFGESLRGFPRWIVGAPQGERVLFWPDFATFVGDPGAAQMMYFASAAPDASVRVVADRELGCWHAFLYRGIDLAVEWSLEVEVRAA